MTDDRYKAIMAELGQPHSHSLLAALRQVANEVAQEVQAAELNSRTVDAMAQNTAAMLVNAKASADGLEALKQASLALSTQTVPLPALLDILRLVVGSKA